MKKEWRDKLHYLPFFTSDFFGDGEVMRMTGQERGMYLLLLMTIWNSKAHYYIPDDDEEITRSMQIPQQLWITVKPAIVRCFDSKDGVLLQKRLLEEYDKAKEKSIKATESASARWGSKPDANAKRTQSKRIAKAMRTVCSPSPSPSPIKKNIIYGEEAFGFEKDPEKDKYKDLVYLTKDEYSKLQKKYGPLMDRILEILDGWKTNAGSKKGHYKSDYKAIIQWVGNKAEEEFQKNKRMPSSGSSVPLPNRNREIDVPHFGPKEYCNKCEKESQTIEHRGMKLCRDCYDQVRPEMPKSIQALLSGKEIG